MRVPRSTRGPYGPPEEQRRSSNSLLGRDDPHGVTEGISQAAVGSVIALGRLLGELDSLGEQFLVGLADVVDRDDRRPPHRPLGDQLAYLLGRRVVLRRRTGFFQQQL